MADLELQKRHRTGCLFKSDPYSRKCRCAIRIIGTTVHGVRVRVSMKTCDWARAARRFAEFEESLRNPEPKKPEKPRKSISEAVTDFVEQHTHCADETIRKYKRLLGFLVDWTKEQGLVFIDELTTQLLDRYQLARGPRSSWTKVKEIELLRQFLNFCLKRKWCEDNPAVNLVRPKIHEANDVEPYTLEEMARILAATGSIGRYPYERLRARAMVLLLRHTGLRISDVITLSRDHVKGSYLDRTCIKNKRRVRIELPSFVLEALDNLPTSKSAPQGCRLYFATGQGSLRSLVKGAWRTLKAVFKRAGVEGAHPHRFHHTLASEILGEGGSIEDAANILGDTPAVIRRHYAKWIPAVQIRQDAILRKIHDTLLTQATECAKPC